ncbi:DNA recombination protein RmuC [Anaeromicrobium sediminis]|uniref:DNA recombination protein RmuC n=1 Tax=Anaeromicrobium sediminis TaxID=1478221 RepID=A0A267MI72_9FIRM|nr:DNA recombination protein RmuC [Anaeromicrobium sediminis]PAB59226.1 DNA recombination protein RmuC [Anaeromicrobium sediminis]
MEIIFIALFVVIIIFQVLILLKFKDINSKGKLSQIEERLIKIEMTSNSIPDSVELKTKGSVKENMMKLSEEIIGRFAQLEVRLNKDMASSTTSLVENFGLLKNQLNKDFTNFKDDMKKDLNEDFMKLNNTVENRLERINEKVEDKLKEGFEKTTNTFNSILERLSKIDEAQKKIDSLSGEIVSLQDVLTDKKSRGIFGEIQLNQILYSVFGEVNDRVFKIQHKLKNNTIVDAMLFAPEPMGNIAIDSKFPLENYKRMMDRNLDSKERENATKEFKINVKKHIDDIAGKYIIDEETANQAIMFLPAEAIFAEINAYHMDIIEYSQRKCIWIASPTTLMAVLTTLQVVLRNAEREKYAHIIQRELNNLGKEFDRYKKRWDNLSKHIDTVHKDVKEIHTTTDKIGKRFDSISKVELEENMDNSRLVE